MLVHLDLTIEKLILDTESEVFFLIFVRDQGSVLILDVAQSDRLKL